MLPSHCWQSLRGVAKQPRSDRREPAYKGSWLGTCIYLLHATMRGCKSFTVIDTLSGT